MTTWRFLGWASSHDWKRLSRYVDWASPIHITVQQMRLRWMETSEAHSIPLLKFRLEAFAENQVENQTKIRTSGEPLLDFGKYQGRSFTSIQMFHTRPDEWDEGENERNGNEMTMKMKWQLLNRNTRGGTQKGKGKEKTPTPTHLARNGQTLKGQGKRKSGRTTGQKPTRGGGGGQKRLTQPTRREPKPTSAREGPKPDLEREHAWDRGPMGT